MFRIFSPLEHIRQQFQMQKSRTRNVESAQIFIVYTLYGAPKWVQTRLTEILNSGPVGGLPTKMDKQPISHTPALSSRFVNIISNWYFSSGWPTVCRRDLYGGIFSSEPETYYIRINKTRIGTNQCKSREIRQDLCGQKAVSELNHHKISKPVTKNGCTRMQKR